MRFTSMSYTNIECVSPSFRHKMSGRDLLRSDGQIRAGLKLALDLFCRTFVFLASGSRKHRTLSLELELSRAFVNSVGKNARNRDGGTTDGHISISSHSRDKNWHALQFLTMAEAMPGKSQELGLNNEQGPVSFLRNRNSSLCTRRNLCGCLWLVLRVSSPF